jgi:2,3-bisphosphoglycerate-dependent phosphoglycerate mutase
MLLYLIRHAQSANNDLYARTGADHGRSADPPLTDLGHWQAQLLARFLAAPGDSTEGEGASQLIGEYAARHNRHGFSLTHLYCSLMTRAVQTGGYIAEATGLPLVGWSEVHERGGLHDVDEATGEEVGVPGPNRAWFAAEYPHLTLPDSLGEAGWWNRPQESVSEAIPRARVVWSQLLERHGGTDDRVAIVSHGGFFQSLITVLLSNGDKLTALHLGAAEIGFGMSNASISRFEIDEGLVVARYLNRVDFLPDELITG